MTCTSQVRFSVQRLLSRNQFQAVLAGTIVGKTPHFILHRKLLNTTGVPVEPGSDSESHFGVHSKLLFSQQTVWLGAIVPKRWARRAVTRNTIRRQIYAVGIDYLAKLAPSAFVVRLRRDFSREQFVSASSEKLVQAVRSELQNLLKSAQQINGNVP